MIWLLFAHFIGDWSLQSDWIAQNKGKYWFVMFAHCAVWTGVVCAFYAAFVRNDGPWTTVGVSLDTWKIVFLFVGHYLCDVWKCRSTKTFPSWHLYVDQLFHILQCFLIWKY